MPARDDPDDLPPHDLPSHDLPPDPVSLDPATRTALDWQARLHSGENEPETAAAYERWLAESPEHRAAGMRAERLWNALGSALRGGRRTITAIVAVIGLGGPLGLMILAGLFGPPAAFFADHSTAIGERRSVVLADGSTIDLDGATSFDVDIGPQRRRLILRGGQIFVTASADPARPFVVETGAGTAQALGTAFNVRRDAQNAAVFVAEHRVRVDAGAVQVVLGEGQGVTMTGAGLGDVEPVDAGRLSAWRRGRLVFQARPLAEVVSAIGRHRRGRIVTVGDGLDGLRVTGSFAADDSDRMLDALELALPIRVLRLPLLTVIRADAARHASVAR